MKTLILKNTKENIEKSAEIIRRGGLVAFPTETVYGLGANGLDGEAVKKVFAAKNRPVDNPMILHIADIEDIYEIAEEVGEDAKTLMENFWPGPLTVVVKRKAHIPDETTGGLDTVGVRMPEEETARSLIREAGVPIAAPSANLSGKPSPTMYKHVVKDMDGRIDAILCGEDCQVGIESTVVLVSGETPIILRPGKITAEDMERVLGKKVELDPALEVDVKNEDDEFQPMSPGMKYKHYAPDAEMIIYEGPEDSVLKEIENRKNQLEQEGKKVGVIVFGSYDFETAAHNLFADLRQMDEDGVDVILAGAVAKEGLGLAVMNRMLKSAGYNTIKL